MVQKKHKNVNVKHKINGLIIKFTERRSHTWTSKAQLLKSLTSVSGASDSIATGGSTAISAICKFNNIGL